MKKRKAQQEGMNETSKIRSKDAVSCSAVTWWNSLSKSGRREFRIKQIGETAFWNSFSISIDEIVDLYEHYR